MDVDLIRRRRVARARTREIDRLPAICHGLARELRAGRSLASALSAVAEDPLLASERLATAVRRAATGASVTAALARWSEELDHPDARLVSAVLAVGATTGSPLADSLDRAASAMRVRAELRAEIESLTAQPRASAALLTAGPFAFLGAMSAVEPELLVVVVATPLGWACLLAGSACDALGWWWMRRLVAAVVR